MIKLIYLGLLACTFGYVYLKLYTKQILIEKTFWPEDHIAFV